MRIGLIARYDNSGLGSMSREFAAHMKPTKALLVQNKVFNTFPERYSEFDCQYAPDQRDFGGLRDWITDGIDVLVAIETPYDWEVFNTARRKGVKTALITMVEMTEKNLRSKPDLFICPSALDYKEMPEPKVQLQFPVNTDVLQWRLVKKAKTFVHSASHWGMEGRKGTSLFLDAIPHVKSNVKFRIYTWHDVALRYDDPRVEIQTINFKNYWQVWREGDVLVYPQNFNGICLPIVEAMSCGMGVITTDLYPFNEYMPKELLFKPREMYKTKINRATIEMDAALIDPVDIAKKIDEVAEMSLIKVSRYGKEWAEKNSWTALQPQWEKVLTMVP